MRVTLTMPFTHVTAAAYIASRYAGWLDQHTVLVLEASHGVLGELKNVERVLDCHGLTHPFEVRKRR